jgi:2-iminobutanoate/2-iminopropanoate deaminase
MVPGVKGNGFLFFSAVRGGGAQRGAGMLDDTEAQARQAFKNLELLLEGAGATLDNVVKVTVYFQDLKYREAFHKVWMEVFPVDPPARTAMQVANASANPGGNAHFVMDVIAAA